MTERIRIEVNDDELQRLIPILDELLFKKSLITGGEIDDLRELESEADFLEVSIRTTVDELTAELLAIETTAIEVKVGLMDAFMGMDLPTVDRATRMLLLRVPGIREMLRLLYQVSMMQRTLEIPGRGTITALLTATIYLSMALTQNQRRTDKLEARMAALEKEIAQRFITMEEATRGYGKLAERYRTVLPQ